ncbi:helicase ATP-binding domain-containing protein [Favolaschia claudopus]|uniref:DNA 5'-3' helicase n=1 Tax=Favolaschia claudopus TaxID=2862362 RepID=A0AAW0ANP6_9AGAR
MFLAVVWLAALGILTVSATSSLDFDDLPTPTLNKSQFVSTHGTNFRVNNTDFPFIGTNVYWLSALNTDEDVDAVLGNISSAGIRVVRTWAFNDVAEIPENGTWFQLVANGTTTLNLNETTGIPKLDRIISMAEKHGIYLLLSLTNNWNPLPVDNTTSSSNSLLRRDVLTNNSVPRNTLSNDYGGMDAYVRAFNASSHDAFYTNETIITAFENYTRNIVSRYVNSTAVLAWEIANDPRCNSSIGATASCNTTTVTLWHARLAQHIRSIDPNHIISSGSQGFFCADCPKKFQSTTAPPPSGPSQAVSSRQIKIAPLTRKRILEERKAARKTSRALKLRSEPPSTGSGVRVRGKWVSTATRRQDDVGVGSAFDGSQGVDSEDILNIPDIGFGSFQLFPDQNQYAPDDPNLPEFNNTLNAGLDWIRRHGEAGQMFGKPVTLSGFGLVTQTNAPSFVPFNSTVAPFANDQIGNLTLNGTLPFGVTDQQRNDAYAQWLQQGIISGLAGMIQYQWGQGNLTAVNGTAISPIINENGLVPVEDQNGLSPSDGYSSQYAYMCDLKRALDATGHCVLEMPSGTGKTVSLLSLIVSYQQFYATRRKLIYCSRTVPEIEKALAELKRLMAYRVECADSAEDKEKERNYTGLGLTSRKNLCIHPEVSKEKKGKVVDARCRDLTNAVTCEKGRNEPGSVDLCDWHETLGNMEPGNSVPPGIWTLADVLQYGRDHGTCPYFTVRRMMPFVDVIIYSFHYLLDPKVAEQVSKELSKDAIVVFDEAHNIDNVCIESLSIDLTRPMLDAAGRSVVKLGDKVEECETFSVSSQCCSPVDTSCRIKTTNSSKLLDEYAKLVDGLREPSDDDDAFMSNPLLPDDLLNEAVPGNIRKAEHFVAFLKRFVEYLKTRMRVLHVVAETPLSFLQHLKDITYIERRPLRFCAERLQSLIRTLELNRLDEYSALQKVASFATLVSTYEKGFLLILEPFETDNASVPNPVFHFTCLDPSLAIQPVFERFSSVVITSGTISPLDMYPKMLQFTPVVQETYPMTLTRNAFLPLVSPASVCPIKVQYVPVKVITRGSDQVAISSRFEVRNDPAVVRNFGSILVEYSKIVPDGIVAFFPSYLYMESIVAAWNDMGILNEVWKNKLIFVETPDANETSIALENYRRACDNGRGAVLLSVARGKVSEGIDFDHNYGRAVIMFGVPYQYTESRILKARLEYLRDAYRIRESEFLGFDAMRNAAQCVGRVLRGKTDWGLMVFADKRFARADKRAKLPRWINQYITETAANLSTDMALNLSKLFMRGISQNPEENQTTGISLWTLEDVLKAQAKQKAALALEEAKQEEQEEDEYGNGDITDQMLIDLDI